MTKVYDNNNFLYHVRGQTAIGIQRCAAEYENERFVSNRVGMHHLCLRARSREDVDAAANKLHEMGKYIEHRSELGSEPLNCQSLAKPVKPCDPPHERNIKASNMAVVLADSGEFKVAAAGDLCVSPMDAEAVTGWTLKPEGMCRDER